MPLDLTDLRLFVAIVDRGSITAGAADAHLALASASARVRALEETLGTTLLERGRRGVRPTAAGEALRDHAHLVLAQMAALKGDLAAHARGVVGRVRLVGNTVALAEFLPPVLAPWLAANPTIGLAADSVDLGGLACFPFAVDRLVLVVPRGHRLARRRHVPFAAAAAEPFVALAGDSALQRHVAGHAARAGRRLAVRIAVQGFDTVCRMVEAGIGVAVVPDIAAARCRRSMAIAAIRLADPWSERRLVVGVRGLAALGPPARSLVEHLRAAARAA
ncbi:LysR family transcriptional regulator [Rhodoplanes azumiensis]|uniref:LysR family transcriptional regulator n=1 Tax=Rhodoplanes azumiensis TaxID=1897628 RepID=A0ABW5AJA6_9BRAD